MIERKIYFPVIFFFVICVIKAELTTDATESTTAAKEEETPLKNLKQAKTKQEKFDYIVNLIRSAVNETPDQSEECKSKDTTLDKPKITSDTTTQKPTIKNELTKSETANETTISCKTLDNIITKISTAVEKKKDVLEKPEIPTMIPIFKPRKPDNPKPTKLEKPQTNLNSIPTATTFQIPCQKAADILDMTVTDINENQANLCSNKRVTKSNISKQVKTRPVTVSAKCIDSDDSVAMLFKPKAISLMQLYGNILKKITVTVLVPYHVSKFMGKQ